MAVSKLIIRHSYFQNFFNSSRIVHFLIPSRKEFGSQAVNKISINKEWTKILDLNRFQTKPIWPKRGSRRHQIAVLLKRNIVKDIKKRNSVKDIKKRKNYFGNNSLLIGASILSMLGFKDEKEEDELVYTIKLAVLSIQKGELDKAEQILHLALRIAQEKMEQQGITYIYDMMANVAYQKKDYKKAEKLFIETMKRLIASGKSESDNAIIEISIKLADIYSSLGENKKAEEGFMFSIETVEKKIGSVKEEADKDTHLLLGMASEMYAHHLLENSRLNKSRVYYENALAICKEHNGSKHPQTLVLLNDLGGVCSLLLDYEAAMKYLKEAIDIGSDTNSDDLPAFYCNLGAVYFKQGNMAEATVMCKKAHLLATKLGNKLAEKDALACLESIKKKNLEAKPIVI